MFWKYNYADRAEPGAPSSGPTVWKIVVGLWLGILTGLVLFLLSNSVQFGGYSGTAGPSGDIFTAGTMYWDTGRHQMMLYDSSRKWVPLISDEQQKHLKTATR